MNLIVTNAKKLNIIQRIRRYIFVRTIKKVNARKYLDAPEYIKRDLEVVEKICDEMTKRDMLGTLTSLTNQDKEVLSKLPNSILFQYITKKQNGRDLLEQLSDDKKISIAGEYSGFIEYCYKDILRYLPEQKQLEILRLSPERAEFASEKMQKNILHRFDRMKYAQYISNDIAKEFIEDSPKLNFRLVSKKIQEDLIEKNPQFLEYASIEVQEKKIKQNKELMQQILVEKPYVISKLRHFFKPEDIHDKISETPIDKITDISKIKQIFLHSKILGAKGTLVTDSQTPTAFFGNGNISHSKSYSWEDGRLISKLTIEQITELIKIDTNYILPRLATSLMEADDTANQPYFINRNIEESKQDCKNIFLNLYGEEQFKKFSVIIDSIYSMQQDYKSYEINYESVSKIPLQQLKILFNTQIMRTNTFDEINTYFEQVFSRQDTHESFMNLIKNAYGEKAANILKNRTNLDVHEINSLEVFDSRIMDNFSVAFVNDLISYNIEEFSGFLEIIKTFEKLQTFKRYYQLLCSNMGENVETMQKAIFEYDYVETLIQNLSGKEITEDILNALYSFLCSKTTEKCKIDIESIEELQNFDNQMNTILMDELNAQLIGQDIKDKNVVKNIKTTITQNIFGIDDSFYIPFIPYDLEEIKLLVNQDEMAFIECLRFIKEENDVIQLMNFTKEVMKEKNIRNPSLIYDVIKRIRANSIQLINNKLLTKEKMDTRIRELQGQKKREDAEIYVEEKNGVQYYHLNGIEFHIIVSGAFLTSRALSLEKVINHEGQSGASSMSLRYVKSDNQDAIDQFKRIINDDKYKNWCGYTHLENDDLILFSDYDGGVDHDNKSVKVNSVVDANDWKIKVPNEVKNEVTIYRRHRNHKQRDNEKLGGKNIPNFWMGEVTAENEKILRKYNIPVLVIHPEKYLENQIGENENITNLELEMENEKE